MYTGRCWLTKDPCFRCLVSMGLHMTAKKSVPCSKKSNYRSPCALHPWQIKAKSKFLLHVQWKWLSFLSLLHRCDYHHSLQSKEGTPDVQNNSDQSCLQVRQENTQTVFKPPLLHFLTKWCMPLDYRRLLPLGNIIQYNKRWQNWAWIDQEDLTSNWQYCWAARQGAQA